jgi:hypothetical protein
MDETLLTPNLARRSDAVDGGVELRGRVRARARMKVSEASEKVRGMVS